MAVSVAVLQIYLNVLGTLDPYIHAMIFMSVMLSLAFILQSPSKKSTDQVARTDLAFSISLLVFAPYVWIHRERFVTRFPLVDPLSVLDLIFGILVIVAVFEAMRRTLGAGMTIVVTVILIYVFTGHLLEGPFYHRYFDMRTFLDHMVFTINGVGGVPMRVAATYVFIFVTLGSFLERSGGGDFFNKLANAIAGGRTGGPAKVAVVSSAAFGTISGSPTSDVATTGCFTIPLMKRLGYTPVFAGAVETTASTGGALLPPIMGTAAFLMVEFTGTPYHKIVTASVIPALLYYLGAMMQVHFRSAKRGLRGLPREELPRLIDAFKDRGEFLMPFGLLIYLIFVGFTPTFAGIICLGLTIPVSWVRRDLRMGPRRIIESLLEAVARLAPLVAACAAAGLVVCALNVTGLASKFITFIGALAEGSPFLALLLSAGVLLLLGMGMPLPVVYILGASLIAPVLMDVGVPMFQAHLFIVFYAALSAITPPVAVAAYTAAGIAEADPMAIGWQAVRLGVAGFAVPFVFAYQPAILLQGVWSEVLWATMTVGFGILFLAIGAEGFCWRRLGALPRLGFLASGVLLLTPGFTMDFVGFVLAGLLVVAQMPRVGLWGKLTAWNKH